MNVVKRSEYCNGVSGEVKEASFKDYVFLADIPKGTVFKGRIGSATHYIYVWVKAKDDAICVGKPGTMAVFVGDTQQAVNGKVYGYKVLNATLVIEGE